MRLKKYAKLLALFFMIILSACSRDEGSSTAAKLIPNKPEGTTEITKASNTSIYNDTGAWNLVWSDEFDGTSINRDIWNYELGYKRNHELQCYTDRPENARIEDGNLVIEGRKEDYNGYKYTSASVNTKSSKSFLYGKIEMRAKLPQGQGIWPAFWTMGMDYKWPACGEIDIMELIGGGPNRNDTIYSTLHWDDNGHKKNGGITKIQKGIFADDYHIFGVEWNEYSVRFFLDNKEYFKQDITGSEMSEFHQSIGYYLTWP